MPDVPTFAELGLAGFEDVPYYGLFAPAGTPRLAIEAFSAAVAKVLARPAVHERLTAMGLLTPNIFAGGQAFHSKEEWVAVSTMDKAVEVILHLAALWCDTRRRSDS